VTRWCLGLALAAAALGLAGLAAAASSFSDATGDNNEAPDLRSVTLAEAPSGRISIAVSVGNFERLPAESWINVWLDLDSNPETGYEGDEALLLYSASSGLAFYQWTGDALAVRPSTGMTSSFASGVLTITAPTEALDGATTFGVFAVGSRSQLVGQIRFIASDSAPDRGRSSYVGPAELAFSDPADDQDSAPDITSVQASDAKSGWISIAVTTSNYERLPSDTLVVLSIDRDNRLATGEAGTDVQLAAVGGETVLRRWDQSNERWVDDEPPTRARVRNSGNVVTFEIHGSELGYTPRLGFSVLALDVDVDANLVKAVDLAPDSSRYYKYKLVNRPALVLTATRPSAVPPTPRAGRPFAVSAGVRRSDTGRRLGSGTVICRVTVDGKRVRASGRLASGRATCAFSVPRSARRIAGVMAVRADGSSVRVPFSYRVG